MLNRPDALELLDAAREALLEQVAPAVEDGLRYQVLMVANALAIAGRELAGTHGEDEGSQLRALYGDAVDPELSIEALNRRLCDDIRRGEMDGAVALGLRRLLRYQVEARLAVSNPRRLAGD